MDRQPNLGSQKRRVPVDEGLYDFSDEELSFIYQSRCSQTEEEDGLRPHLLNHSDFDISSETKSISEGTLEVFFGDKCKWEQEMILGSAKDLMSPSSLSQYSFGTEETDQSYPEIEVIRGGIDLQDSNSDHGSNIMSPNAKESLITSSRNKEYNNEMSCSRDEIDHHSAMQKKIIVPEPELSDPNFLCSIFEDSIEEDRSLQLMSKAKQTLSQKISTLGRLLPLPTSIKLAPNQNL